MGFQWYYAKGSQQYGPVTAVKLRELAASGRLQQTDLVWKEGMRHRIEARLIKGLWPSAVSSANQSPSIPSAGAPSSSSPPTSLNWYYAIANQRQGPVTAERLKQLAASGQLQPGDLVWQNGMSQWVLAGSVKELLEVLPARSTDATVPSAATTASPPTSPAKLAPKPSSSGSKWAWATDKNHPASQTISAVFSVLFLLGICTRFYLRHTGKDRVRQASHAVASQPAKATMEVAGAKEKLLAFRRLVRLYEGGPQGDVSLNELRKHQAEVELLQRQFIAMPFDFRAHPKEAKEIVELYLQKIEGNYDGAMPFELRSHIEPMWEAFHDEVRMPRRLLDEASH